MRNVSDKSCTENQNTLFILNTPLSPDPKVVLFIKGAIHSVKLSDFTVWRRTWRKKWVNCAGLTGNSAGLRTVLSSRLSHGELRSSFREPHSFLSLPADTTMASSQGTQQNWQKTDKPDGKSVLCQRTFSSVFLAVFFFFFFTQLNCTV